MGCGGTLWLGLHREARTRGLFRGHRIGSSQKLFSSHIKAALLCTETRFEINYQKGLFKIKPAKFVSSTYRSGDI